MALLGKRKSRDGETASADVSELDAAAIFRRHFEAQFAPLDDEDEAAARAQREQDDDDAVDSDLNGDDDGSDDEDAWGGFSSAEEEDGDGSDDDDDEVEETAAAAVQVIDHSKPQIPKEPKMSKKELKAFMSSKVIDHTAPQPSPSASSSSSSAKPAKPLPEDAPSLLAQDLELRRLLSESHLLTPSHNNAASASVFSSSVVHGTSAAAEPKTFSAGRTRQRATDLRLQALGSKGSVLAQERMPMSMRKGMVAAAGAREAKRRREAKENGVILERSSAAQTRGGGKKKGGSGGGGGGGRGRGGDVHSPGVGRMRGAELRISESDVRKIEGSRDAFGRSGRGRGRR